MLLLWWFRFGNAAPVEITVLIGAIYARDATLTMHDPLGDVLVHDPLGDVLTHDPLGDVLIHNPTGY